MDFKYLVIGCGIMGSAAAMHLAASSNGVGMLGPDEDMAERDDQTPKGSHHDVGRITRGLDPDPFWGSLARQSIQRYRELERKSGIGFFNECGFLWLDTQPDRLDKLELLAADDAQKVARVSQSLVKEEFFYLNSDNFVAAIYQTGQAGTLDPRAYVRAMTEVAKTAGVERICDHAVRLEPTSNGIAVQTAADRCMRAGRVLLATGTYAALDRLVGRKLPLQARKTGVVLVEVASETAKQDFADMPSIISRPPANRLNAYLLPPLMYPDGKFYLKIGTSTPGVPINDSSELNRWLRVGEDKAGIEMMLEELRLIFPHLDLSKWRYLPCVTCHTPDAHPIIDVIGDGRIGLLLGGNGFAAKSGDALGELGARLLLETSRPGTTPAGDLSLARFDINQRPPAELGNEEGPWKQ